MWWSLERGRKSRKVLVGGRKKDKTSDDLQDRPFVIPSSITECVGLKRAEIEERRAARLDR